MHDTLALVLTHVRMVWRFRWVALVVASIICAVGWAGVVLLPDQYRVEAKVFLDTSSLLRPLLRGLAVDNRSQEQASAMMRRTLLVRPNLETVVRKTDMDLEANTPGQFEALLTGLASKIQVGGTARDNIFVIAYENSDPQLANRVVEAILNLFVERSLGESRKDAGKTRQFLDRQIAEYEARLTAAENRLKEFKQNNVGMMPGEGGSYFARMEGMNQGLAGARLQLEEVMRRRDEYQRQLDGVETLFEPELTTTRQARAMPHPLDGRIQSLEQQLDQLLMQYTEKHPDVASTRDIIANLKTQRDETPVPQPEPLMMAGGGGGSSIQQELSMALGQTEAEVAALTARVQEYERRAEELRKLVDTIPRIEAELVRLNRDYEVDKRNYDELVKRRESLALSEQASQTNEGLQFNIIDPPRVPLKPIGPNRPILSAGVLVAGLGAGVGFAWLLAMVRPALYRREEVEQALNLPVIGTVTRTWTRGEVVRRRMEVGTFVLGCVLLVGTFSALLSIEIQHADLLDRVRDAEVLKDLVRKVGTLV
jgi:polysaccharide chain length determinant protein (PEP-CTERM system associated)